MKLWLIDIRYSYFNDHFVIIPSAIFFFEFSHLTLLTPTCVNSEFIFYFLSLSTSISLRQLFAQFGLDGYTSINYSEFSAANFSSNSRIYNNFNRIGEFKIIGLNEHKCINWLPALNWYGYIAYIYRPYIQYITINACLKKNLELPIGRILVTWKRKL